jgi:hypothetical protein
MFYILNGCTPVPEPNITKFVDWIIGNDNLRTVGLDIVHTETGQLTVSTIFTGVKADNCKAQLFETMVFDCNNHPIGNAHHTDTWDSAKIQHINICSSLIERSESD